MREIPLYPGYYADEHGSIYSRRPRNGRGPLAQEPRLLRPCKDKDGYWSVSVHNETGKRREPIHRLVLMSFSLSIPTGKVARHLDGNKDNNGIGNLMWGTPAENSSDTAKHGSLKGEKNPSAKLSREIVMRIREAKTTKSYKALSDEFGVSKFCVFAICTRKTWSHID